MLGVEQYEAWRAARAGRPGRPNRLVDAATREAFLAGFSQGVLSATEARARTADPDTSHAAPAKIALRAWHERLIPIYAEHRADGLTHTELERAVRAKHPDLAFGASTVRSRSRDLEVAGLIRRGERREVGGLGHRRTEYAYYPDVEAMSAAYDTII